jgi:hypothetical protein
MGIISLSIYYDIDINNMEKCYRVIILARSMLKLLDEIIPILCLQVIYISKVFFPRFSLYEIHIGRYIYMVCKLDVFTMYRNI